MRQAERRANGEPSGREAGLNEEVRADRKYNGGKLTPGERKQVNNQQNKLSKSIYKANVSAILESRG